MVNMSFIKRMEKQRESQRKYSKLRRQMVMEDHLVKVDHLLKQHDDAVFKLTGIHACSRYKAGWFIVGTVHLREDAFLMKIKRLEACIQELDAPTGENDGT